MKIEDLKLDDLLKNLPPGTDYATLQKMEQRLQDDHELRKQFEANINNEGFKKTIEKLANEIENLFNHNKDSR